MQELRLVAVSEDGSYAVLVVPGRSGRFALPIDERLRTVARGQFSRLAQYEIEVESPLRPKEIQDRIRAGETAEDIADAAGLPVDRIRRFEGPPLAERARWAAEAQRATVRGQGEPGPGRRLGEVVTERLADLGASAEDVDWDSRKRQDGSWQVQLAYTVAGRMHMAEWVYDVRSKHVTPDDDEAIRLCLDEAFWPEPRPAARAPATATVTPIGSRSAATHQQAAHQQDGADRRGVHPSRQAPAANAGGRHQQAALRQAGPGAAEVQPGTGPSRREPAPSRQEPAPPRQEPAPPARVEPAQPAQPSRREPAAVAAALEPAADDEQDGMAPAAAAQESAQAARPARRSGGRSRRSSVPSWDEIMFGNSRQPE